MIWGLTLKPGVSYTRILDEEVHLSLASMESREEFGRIWPGSYAQVVMKTEDMEFLLCTLIHGSNFQQTLDLKLMPKEKITFTAYGECIIYISGYSTSCPRIHKVRSVIDRVIDGALANPEGTSMINDKEMEDSSWIPEPEDQTEEQRERTLIQVKEEEEQDCIEVMGYEDDSGVVKSETQNHPNYGGALPSRTENTDEYSVVPSIVSYAQESVMAAVQEYSVADVHESGNVREGSDRGQMTTNAGPVPTSLMKVENSSSKENEISVQSISRSPPFGSRQVVGTLGAFSAARTRSCSGLPNSLQKNKVTSNNPSFPLQEDRETAASFVLSVSGKPVSDTASSQPQSLAMPSETNDAPESDTVLSYVPKVKVKNEISRRIRSKKRGNSGQKGKLVASQSGQKYKCPFCPKSFMHSHSMVRHERIHTGIKPYQCRICGKRFSDIGNKAKHERTHTGGKGFNCSYCGKTFNSFDSHRKHVKSCMR